MTDIALSTPIQTEHAPHRRWWWPYTHGTVVKLFIALLILKIAVGAMAGIGISSRRYLIDWIWLLERRKLTYDFAWSELTEGEGSLFWLVAAKNYSEDDPKNIAKFPLYPAVVRFLWDLSGRVFSIPFLLSLVHSFMVWAGLAETYRFWERYRSGYGYRAILWLLVSPLFVLHLWLASFMEPGFIALIWLSLTLENNRKWALSSAALLCLTMLQPSGIILAFFIGLHRLYHWYKGTVPTSAVGWAFLPAVGWGAWMFITSLWLSRPLAPYAFQADWGRDVYMWPWDRWAIFNNELAPLWGETGRVGQVISNISFAWITLSFVACGWLWIRLPSQQKRVLGGSWMLPLFTFIVVAVPFSTLTNGVQRYAETTLIGIWPLLFAEATQSHRRFRQLERVIWVISLMVCLLILFAFITGYKDLWNLYFN